MERKYRRRYRPLRPLDLSETPPSFCKEELQKMSKNSRLIYEKFSQLLLQKNYTSILSLWNLLDFDTCRLNEKVFSIVLQAASHLTRWNNPDAIVTEEDALKYEQLAQKLNLANIPDQVVRCMSKIGFKPNLSDICWLVQIQSKLGNHEMAMSLLSSIERHDGFFIKTDVYRHVIICLNIAKKYFDSLQIFTKILLRDKDDLPSNLWVCAKFALKNLETREEYDWTVEFFEMLKENDIQIKESLHNEFIRLIVKHEGFFEGCEVLKQSEFLGHKFLSSAYNNLLLLSESNSQFDAAWKIFLDRIKKDPMEHVDGTFSLALEKLYKNKRYEEVLTVYNTMLQLSVNGRMTAYLIHIKASNCLGKYPEIIKTFNAIKKLGKSIPIEALNIAYRAALENNANKSAIKLRKIMEYQNSELALLWKMCCEMNDSKLLKTPMFEHFMTSNNFILSQKAVLILEPLRYIIRFLCDGLNHMACIHIIGQIAPYLDQFDEDSLNEVHSIVGTVIKSCLSNNSRDEVQLVLSTLDELKVNSPFVASLHGNIFENDFELFEVTGILMDMFNNLKWKWKFYPELYKVLKNRNLKDIDVAGLIGLVNQAIHMHNSFARDLKSKANLEFSIYLCCMENSEGHLLEILQLDDVAGINDEYLLRLILTCCKSPLSFELSLRCLKRIRELDNGACLESKSLSTGLVASYSFEDSGITNWLLNRLVTVNILSSSAEIDKTLERLFHHGMFSQIFQISKLFQVKNVNFPPKAHFWKLAALMADESVQYSQMWISIVETTNMLQWDSKLFPIVDEFIRSSLSTGRADVARQIQSLVPKAATSFFSNSLRDEICESLETRQSIDLDASKTNYLEILTSQPKDKKFQFGYLSEIQNSLQNNEEYFSSLIRDEAAIQMIMARASRTGNVDSMIAVVEMLLQSELGQPETYLPLKLSLVEEICRVCVEKQTWKVLSNLLWKIHSSPTSASICQSIAKFPIFLDLSEFMDDSVVEEETKRSIQSFLTMYHPVHSSAPLKSLI